MKIAIPYPESDSDTFLDIDVRYDVVATAGPPLEADFGIKLARARFIEFWGVALWEPHGITISDTCDNYEDIESPYDDYIRAYIEDNKDAILEACRDFELTDADNMV